MKRNIKNLVGYTIGPTDGEIGKVKEFYFDDQSWTIRHLIVETGKLAQWLFADIAASGTLQYFSN